PVPDPMSSISRESSGHGFAVGADEGERAVQGLAQAVRVTACLGEDEAALAAGQDGSGRPVGVGLGPEFAGGDHTGQACADAGFPALEARDEDGAGLVITFAGLADEVGHEAAAVSAALLLELNQGAR